jgi:hypothetical protein
MHHCVLTDRLPAAYYLACTSVCQRTALLNVHTTGLLSTTYACLRYFWPFAVQICPRQHSLLGDTQLQSHSEHAPAREIALAHGLGHMSSLA